MQNTQRTVNADPAELRKFSDLAGSWWDLKGHSRPLHEINPFRLHWINQHDHLAGKHILDVGCGGGILAESMALKKAAHVTGIDLSIDTLQAAKLHALDQRVNNLSYQCVSVEQLAKDKPEKFDVVTCMEMLEHVPDPASVVLACEKLLKPGGWAFFSTINRNPKSWLFAIVGAEYVLRLLPRGTHEFNKFIRPAELSYFIRQAGLTLVDSSGLAYNPISQRYRLSTNVSVNYMLATKKM